VPCRVPTPPPSRLLVFTDTAPTSLSTLSLHDALPIYLLLRARRELRLALAERQRFVAAALHLAHEEDPEADHEQHGRPGVQQQRSEEHTSELQSRFDLVCRLLLEKKNKRIKCVKILQR